MDLWQALARLRHRPWLVGGIVLLSVALGVAGWLSTTSSYSVSTSHVLRADPAAGGATAEQYSVGSYESGMLAAMLTTNLNTVGSSVEGVTVTANNSIVSPPTMLPMITITVTADAPDDAIAAADEVLVTNEEFLRNVTAGESGLSIAQVNPTHAPVESSQPRVRSAGAGLILGLLFGTLALLLYDTLARSRGKGPGTKRRRESGPETGGDRSTEDEGGGRGRTDRAGADPVAPGDAHEARPTEHAGDAVDGVDGVATGRDTGPAAPPAHRGRRFARSRR